MSLKNNLMAAAAVLGLAMGTNTAFAADLPVSYKAPAPMMAPAYYDWSGFYVGGHAGGAWANGDGTWDIPAALGIIDTVGGSLNGSGFTGGVHIGMNWMLSPTWVVGIEADWSWSKIDDQVSGPFSILGGLFAIPGSLATVEREINWVATVRGRVGATITPHLLAYVTGGVAFADMDYNGTANVILGGLPVYAGNISSSKTETGWVLGGGFEWAVMPNWHVRAEYLYHRFGGETLTAANTGLLPLPAPSVYQWDNTELHVVRAGLSYKF